LKGSISASVGGIVLLLQGNENRLKPLHTKEAVRAYIEQFMVRPETEKEIQALARIIDQMLRNIPSFSFENTGDGESTVMLRTAFIEL
ncbi:MAG: hypothetical protein IJU25_03035, partial [Lachnospiraceae bacterium]|nr:hypothetical protein [Lachnospiraceae bacterium]